ncbi:MAG: radical SAM protein [bacterium]
MPPKIDYARKFEKLRQHGPFNRLDSADQACVRELAVQHRLTFQEFRQVAEAAQDLSLWGEGGLAKWWQDRSNQENSPVRDLQNGGLKKLVLSELQAHVQQLRRAPKSYPQSAFNRPKKRKKSKIVSEHSDKNIFGMCPAASEKTVCCNLRTIDAVENCIFGCSYCTIQTFYSDKIVFDDDFVDKLQKITLDPNRFYHIGTGQSSDSLAWGNRNGILDALCRFAAENPNILLEFKTKSDNISYFFENATPRNIVCSWSMNTPTIIDNEEHFTANLDRRIAAARQVADRGVKVAFHFHPMVYYRDWQKDYPRVAETLMRRFKTDEVLFISFGSVTLIKPVLNKIRNLGYQTKITRMEFVADPLGKLTYPDQIKIAMFKTMYETFQPWRDSVFFYLCMEKAAIWEQTFGYVYEHNEIFEKEFGRMTLGRKVNGG